MKKYIIIPMILLLNAIGARAQYDKSWTFESWGTTASLESDLKVDGLTAHATSTYFVAVEEKKKINSN